MAWDPVNGKKVWTVTDKYPLWSGTVATAGDLVFFGTLDGWFRAAIARTGRTVWQFKTGSGIIGQPVTYRGPDGKQYVAILVRHRRLARSDRLRQSRHARRQCSGGWGNALQ